MENMGTLNTQMQKGINNILLQAPLLFRNFSSEDLRDFLKIGQPLIYKKEDLIIDEATRETDPAFLIISGVVSVWKDEIHLATLSNGDFIGETFLFSKGGRTASVSAMEDTFLLEFKRAVVLDYFRSKPERLFKLFIMNIIEIQQRKISSMNMKLIQLQRRLLNKDSSE